MHAPLQTVSFESLSLTRSLEVLTQGVAQGVAPGFVAAVYSRTHPKQMILQAIGNRARLPAEAPVFPNTYYDLASLTKVVATTPLVAALVERGWLNWDTPVRSILPEYRFSEVRVSHLLDHSAGYEAWRPLWEELRADVAPKSLGEVSRATRRRLFQNKVLEVDLQVPPGTRALYSDFSFLVLQMLLERLTGLELDHAVKDWVWGPFGLSELTYSQALSDATQLPSRFEGRTVASTEQCAWRGGVLCGQVHDDNAWSMGGVAGHAGVFGTATGVLCYARALLEGELFSASTRERLFRKSTLSGSTRAFGWDTPSATGSAFGSFFSRHSVGHLGFTGTSLWMDLDRGVAVVLLSNRVHPVRDNEMIRNLRPEFHDRLFEDLRAVGMLHS